MNLSILSVIMLVVFMFLVMTKRVTPLTALILIPTVFGIIAAVLGLFPVEDIPNPTLLERLYAIGEFAKSGVSETAGTGVLLLFAILYFATMLATGVFDPITKALIRFAGGDPLKILFVTAFVSMCVSLNGDGTTTTLIVCTAFLPIYKKLGLKIMNLGVLLILMNTIMNLLPWGGPTARAISVLALNDKEVIQAIIPGMVVSAIYVLGVSLYLGMKERKRVGIISLSAADLEALEERSEEEEAKKRPQYFWFNLIMTIAIIVGLIVSDFPSLFLFAVGTIVALVVNYHSLKEQKARIAENAADAVSVVILVFGAGIFMGIFNGTGMAEALATLVVTAIPASLGNAWGLIVAIVSAPGTYFLSNDAFYYGVLPVVAEAGVGYGFTNLQLGIASLLGQAFHLLSPLVAFIYLLLELTGLEMVEWQKETAKWAVGIFIIFIVMAQLTGIVLIK
ncbi:citrate:proton symporter [Peptoniphilus equinus]|uniref:Citrate:proton symporter n=1 Tax=Peptoniphilus equinus TaxID=3016343 RepID=A0ABY7QS98_9FIRM|nr:citrate:proton symporter [Peptoniphilus equinus]WBW49659.1 citrate:proton symporter [Peptoniphilus equinus]